MGGEIEQHKADYSESEEKNKKLTKDLEDQHSAMEQLKE